MCRHGLPGRHPGSRRAVRRDDAHCGTSIRREHYVNVRDGMSKVVLSVGPAHTLREAARRMSARRVGAAVVVDPSHPGIGILTERDILDSIGAGQDPDTEMVADHRTSDVVFASPDWTLEQAASAMSAGNFRHLIVVEDDDVAGLLSMRDIVRCWSGARVAASVTA
jgi:CBS domain-containing protein